MMPTARCFSKCPPFHSDVPVANIQTISLDKLECNDVDESKRLFQACREHGFFLLDLQTSSNVRALLEDAEAMFELVDEVMNMGKDTLSQYAYQPPRTIEGYKASGLLKTDDGNLDAMEMYTVSRDDILDKTTPLPKPPTFTSRKLLCQNFTLHADDAVTTILSTLSTQLSLPPDTLPSRSPLHKPSGSNFRLLRAQPTSLRPNQKITLGGHTDFGTMTLLFNVVGGLQILLSTSPSPNSESDNSQWQYIKPRPGHAIVNIGDTLVEWTGGVLKSCLHRVMNPPGEQANNVRRSVAYFSRPSFDASMARIEGSPLIPRSIAVVGRGEERQGDGDAEGESVGKGVDVNVMTVDEWAQWRTAEIINGRLKPETRGGVSVPLHVPVNIDQGGKSTRLVSVTM